MARQAQVDHFRLEDGLIVEHWDNAEPVPVQDEWADSRKS
jgi:predicted SnoaL-like aldol condensation-catalyzing enzyme